MVVLVVFGGPPEFHSLGQRPTSWPFTFLVKHRVLWSSSGAILASTLHVILLPLRSCQSRE